MTCSPKYCPLFCVNSTTERTAPTWLPLTSPTSSRGSSNRPPADPRPSDSWTTRASRRVSAPWPVFLTPDRFPAFGDQRGEENSAACPVPSLPRPLFRFACCPHIHDQFQPSFIAITRQPTDKRSVFRRCQRAVRPAKCPHPYPHHSVIVPLCKLPMAQGSSGGMKRVAHPGQ